MRKAPWNTAEASFAPRLFSVAYYEAAAAPAQIGGRGLAHGAARSNWAVSRNSRPSRPKPLTNRLPTASPDVASVDKMSFRVAADGCKGGVMERR